MWLVPTYIRTIYSRLEAIGSKWCSPWVISVIRRRAGLNEACKMMLEFSLRATDVRASDGGR